MKEIFNLKENCIFHSLLKMSSGTKTVEPGSPVKTAQELAEDVKTREEEEIRFNFCHFKEHNNEMFYITV